jgi:DNA-binding LytR/AlgR family response regulator
MQCRASFPFTGTRMKTVMRSMINNRMKPIRCHGGILLVDPDKISWVKAARNSVKVHFDGQLCFLKSSLECLERQLNSSNFVRIHRCTIVNVNCIRELRHWLRGTFQVFLEDGTQLLLSKSYRINFFKHLRLRHIE